MSLLAKSFLAPTAAIELTFACNHSCLFCSCPWYAGLIKQQGEMNVQQWQQCLAELAQNGVNTFSFTGGEMLMKKGWEQIVRFAAALECYHLSEDENSNLCYSKAPAKIYMLSNGKLMSDYVLDFCRELGIHLSMSLPGLDTFDAHTRSGLKAQHILDWFSRAREKQVSTTVGITVTAQNFHELQNTVRAAIAAGAGNVLINRFLPGGRGLYNRHLDLTPQQIAAIPLLVDEVLAASDVSGHIGTEYPYCLAAPAFEHGLRKLEVGTTCGAVRGFFVVGPNGMLRACNHSPKQVAHWSEWRQLIHDPYWRSYLDDQTLPAECSDCVHSDKCGGGCREAAHVCFGCHKALDPAVADLQKSPS